MLLPLVAGAQVAADGDTPAQESPLAFQLGAGGTYLESRSRTDGGNGREFVGTLTPGVSYVSRRGVLRGALDYQAALNLRRGYAETAGSDVENRLSSAFVLDLVPRRLAVDLQAAITQQQISAFGEQQVEGPTLSQRNRTETRSLSVSPSLRGQLGGLAQYDVRARGNVTRSKEQAGVDSSARNGSIDLRSPSPSALLGWFAQANWDRVTYEDREPVETGRGIVGLQASPAPEFRVNLRGGRESQVQGTTGPATWSDTYGGGLGWQPSPRTQLQLDADERYFGRAVRAAFSHRMPRSIVTYSFSRDTTQSALQTSQAVTLYDLLYRQSESAFPDPAARDAAVRDLLRNNGQDGAQIVSPEFQTSSVSVQRRQDLAFTWLGRRTTVVAQGFTTSVAGLIFVSGQAPTTTEPATQHGYNGSLSYRLTPVSSVQLGGSRRMTKANSLNAGSDLKNAFASMTLRSAGRATATLGARYTVFNSATSPYRETGLTASLNLRF